MSFTPSFRPDPKKEKQAKKKRKRIAHSPIKVKRKKTGEGKVFQEIWNEREHICTNCGTHLGEEMYSFFFAHIKPKGRENSLRLVKENIMLHCFVCHQLHDQGTKSKYEARTDLYQLDIK